MGKKNKYYKGIVTGNVVVLEDGNSIPEGTKVIVIPEREIEKKPDFESDPFLTVDEWAPLIINELPGDLAHQHDHYLYGTEKDDGEKVRFYRHS